MKKILIALMFCTSLSVMASKSRCNIKIPKLIEVEQSTRDLNSKYRSKHISTSTEVYESLVRSIRKNGYTIVADSKHADLEILEYDVWVQDTSQEGFHGAASIQVQDLDNGDVFSVFGGKSFIFYKTSQADAISDAFDKLNNCEN